MAGNVYIGGSSLSQGTVTGGAKECMERCLGYHSDHTASLKCRSFNIQRGGNVCGLNYLRPGDDGVAVESSPDWWLMRRPDWYLSEIIAILTNFFFH